MRPLFRPQGPLKWLLAAPALAALVACGGGPITIGGRVVDHRGSPLAKAEVQTEPETDVVVSNNRGFFLLRQRINDLGETEAILPGVYRVKVRKFGFEDLDFEVKVEDDGPAKVSDLVMQPRTPDIGETAPEVTDERPVTAGETSVPVSGQ
ncbi:MAG: carboxypeptidase-like regulatory domain-containing protein [bacterium]